MLLEEKSVTKAIGFIHWEPQIPVTCFIETHLVEVKVFHSSPEL